jgi:tetratricopeptide (TPR) repeat protein
MKRSLIACVILALAIALSDAGCAHRQPTTAPTQARVQAPSLGLDVPGGKWTATPAITAQTRFAAGQLAESRDEYKTAAEQYAAAADLDPTFLLAIYRLGVCYAHLHDWNKSIQTWNWYIAVTGGDASAWSNLGFCYELSKDIARAEEAYKKGIQRDPMSESCRVNYGLMLARHGRIREAVEQFSVVLTPAQIHYNLGSVHEQQQRANKAKEEFESALKIDPNMKYAKTRIAAIDLDE